MGNGCYGQRPTYTSSIMMIWVRYFFFPVRWHKVNDVLRTITDRPNPDTSALKSQKIITNDDSANPLKD